TKDAANQEVKKNESSLKYIVLPNWAHDALLKSTSSKPYEESISQVPEGSGNPNPTASVFIPPADQIETLTVESLIPTVSSPVLTACLNDSSEPSGEARLVSKDKPYEESSSQVPEGSGNYNSTASTFNPSAEQMETLTVESPIPTASSPVPTACLNDSLETSSEARLVSKRVAHQEEINALFQKGFRVLRLRFKTCFTVLPSSLLLFFEEEINALF
nr:hypothetical protein [Tanacetum cinerariifolium]